MEFSQNYLLIGIYVAFIIVFLGLMYFLRKLGRKWWCECGKLNLWSSGIWNKHTSQHMFDAYSFTHMVWGIAIYFVMQYLLPNLNFPTKLLLSTLLGAGWEIFENTSFVINRYRRNTISSGYIGDSILNSMGDVLVQELGFVLASYLETKYSIIIVAFIELGLLATICDNTTLNTLMQIYPIESVKQWQLELKNK